MEISSLQLKIDTLHRSANEFLHIGDSTGYVYSDDFTRLNHDIHIQIDTLYRCKGKTIEQEAELCLSILMGYSVMMYANPSDEQKKQHILSRSHSILQQLPDTLLKSELHTYTEFCFIP